jgi:lipopolysaccharide/colanic/teichoic acid biosynthesis glycosyltransferase
MMHHTDNRSYETAPPYDTAVKVGCGRSGRRTKPIDKSGAGRSSIARDWSKRVLDITIASSALAVLSPLLVVIAVSVRATSRGPILFSQTRWGINQKKIRVYKFRTMRTELCDLSGITQTTPHDRRLTQLGGFLRRTNLDELPQFYNVLIGNMSLVGPRCHPIGMLSGGMPYEQLVPKYHSRHMVKPGMTGLAQIRGLRGPTVENRMARARIACDLYYVRNRNMWLDLRILVSTVTSQIINGNGF